MRALERRFVDSFASLVIVHLNPIYMRGEVSRVPSLLSGIRTVQDLLPATSGGSSFFLDDGRFSFADIAVAPFLGRMYAVAKSGLIPDVYAALTSDPAYMRMNDYAQSLFSRKSFRDTFPDEKVPYCRNFNVVAIG
jgi:glutathione S-transferase